MHAGATWNYEQSPHFLEVIDNPCLYGFPQSIRQWPHHLLERVA